MKKNGDRWEMLKPILVSSAVFKYKFAIFDSNGKFIQYERGIDRIADLKLLDGTIEGGFTKTCRLHHIWQKYKVTFAVSVPPHIS